MKTKFRLTEHTGLHGNKWWTVERVYKWWEFVDPMYMLSESFDDYNKALEFYNGLISGENGRSKILKENEVDIDSRI